MAIQKIDDIYELLKGNTQKKRLVVAYANDSHSIEAVNKAGYSISNAEDGSSCYLVKTEPEMPGEV